MKVNLARHKENLILLIVAVALILLYHFMVERRAVVQLDLTTDTRTILKVYWPRADGRFTEKSMARITITPGVTHYRFRICDIEGRSMLRLDPAERPAKVVLHSLVIVQEGFPNLRFDQTRGLHQLTPRRGIAGFKLGDNGLQVESGGPDPQLYIPLPIMTRGPTLVSEALRAIALILVVFFIGRGTLRLWQDYLHVTHLMAFILALIVVMASISLYNHHPDEYVHVAAARYFQDHFLPPKIESPEILNTYSPYGVSRLHSGEIVYLIAGKVLGLVRPFHLPVFLVLRLFNVSLFLILVILAVQNKAYRVLLLPLLISAQVWYVFSYFNSDAFALFITLLCAYQIAVPDSMLNNFATGGLSWRSWWHPLAVGFLLALLLLVKKNFYFFYVFLFCYSIWKMVFADWRLTPQLVLRLGVVVLVGMVLAGSFWGLDYRVNGPDRAAKLEQAREHLARKMYRPSTPLSKLHPYLLMKKRGISLKEVLQRYRWGEKSFRTSFGVYDYTSISGPFSYYNMVRYTGLLLLASLLVPVAIRGGSAGISLALLTLVMSVALLAVALHHAWTVDFQAQGRYFLPILAMVSIYLYHEEHHLAKPLFHLLTLAMFLLGAYSFIFVGLHAIAKYSI